VTHLGVRRRDGNLSGDEAMRAAVISSTSISFAAAARSKSKTPHALAPMGITEGWHVPLPM
jgi:hypothetical protein